MDAGRSTESSVRGTASDQMKVEMVQQTRVSSAFVQSMKVLSGHVTSDGPSSDNEKGEANQTGEAAGLEQTRIMRKQALKTNEGFTP